jgi:hypothetical protein
MLGEEVRVTVVAAGFDKVALAADNRFESRLSRLLEEPVRSGDESADAGLPSLLADDDQDVFSTDLDQPASVSFDAEEDLDIPDFLKN